MKILVMLLILSNVALAKCQLLNLQCTDKAATKVINGHTFNLADACAQFGLTGDQCCWNTTSQYYCGDATDTCQVYRKNADCSLNTNTCIDKDYITGTCNKYQSEYSCAGGYADVESKVCTNVVCSSSESGVAKQCFNPKPPTADNTKNMGNAIAYIQMGQAMAQNMQCANTNDPTSCTLFAGKYFSCYMYGAIASQAGSYNNGGSDCMIHHEDFTKAGVPMGYSTSDRNLYSQATSGTSNVMGNNLNYSLSMDDTQAINNSVKLKQKYNIPITNQDQNVHYDGNNSKNPNMGMHNGQVVSVSINKSAIQDVEGFTSFKVYLSDQAVNLAWNRQKSEPDPNNVKSITFKDEGITRGPSGNPFAWNDAPNQPVINGLCVHFADYCDGGDDEASGSSAIRLFWAGFGGLTNVNFCAQCVRDPIFHTCTVGLPKSTLQQWCCFSSKVALDINLAAYDQGLLNIYTGNSNRNVEQMTHANNICGGVTVGMISKIDFSKGNYFNDLMSSIDINQLVDTSSFTSNVTSNTQNRANGDAINMINEWKNKRQ